MPKQFTPIDRVLPVACGIDIHKKFMIAVICDETVLHEPVYFKERFSLLNSGLENLENWLVEHNCFHVCMESTGKYWIPAFNALEPVMNEVRIVNPKWVKQVKGEKDDQKDAVMICNKYRHGETRASFIPERRIRNARVLARTRTKLTQQVTTVTNRLNGLLFSSGCRLDIVFSSTKTKSARKIILLITGDEPWTDEDILKCVDGRCRTSRKDILEAVHGAFFTSYEKREIRRLVKEREELEGYVEEINKELKELFDDDREMIETLCTIPGINEKAAWAILAEIGTVMSIFLNPGRLARWAGLAQDRNESADRKYSNRIGQGGKYLKPILVQCAWAAVRSKDPYYRMKFDNIASRRGAKRAIIAIARKMLVSIWAMLTYGEEWHPKDMNKNGCPRNLDIQKSKRKLTDAISELVSLGKSPEDLASEVTAIIQKAA